MAGLDIKLKPLKGDDNAYLAEMSGAIDGNTVATFQSTLEEIKDKGVKCLILDMSKIKYVNSTGLGSLVKYADQFKNSGGGMALIKVPAKVKIVIEMLGLNAFFEICADLDAARAALGGSSGGGGAPVAPVTQAEPRKPEKVRPLPGQEPAQVSQPTSAPVAVSAPNANAGFNTGASVAPVAAGALAYPYTTDCQSCGVKLRFNRQGAYKCPRCFTRIHLNGSGGPVFSVPNKSAGVALTLPARQECGLGLLHLVHAVCESALSQAALDAVRHSVHEVTQVLQGAIYDNNPNGLYHVTIDVNSGRVDVRIADHGKNIDTTRLPLYFPNATRYMDSFECVAHPSGGNIIRMSKAG